MNEFPWQGYAITLTFTLALLWAAARRPAWARWAFALLFLVAGLLNAVLAARNPTLYSAGFAPQSFGPVRAFIEGSFAPVAGLFVVAIALGQIAIAALLAWGGRALKVGLFGAAVFLIAISGLGTGAAFPLNLLLAWAAVMLWRDPPPESPVTPPTKVKRRLWPRLLASPLLIAAYFALFAGGSVLLPAELQNTDEAAASASALGMLLMALFDVALLCAIAKTSRLRGMKLWVLLAVILYGVKTFTSQIEAVYFMPNVGQTLAPSLLAMGLPVAIGISGLVTLLFGTGGNRTVDRDPPLLEWLAPGALLGVIAYPFFFFTFGYFVAWSVPELRAFYGGGELLGFLPHLRSQFASDPWVLPFEMLRGLLWVAMAVPILRTTRGPWWVGTLWVALLFSIVQNDVHLLPNPLMPATVREVHFIETASSNLLFALLIGVVLYRPWRRARTVALRLPLS